MMMADETDASPFISLTETNEHYDAALVFADPDCDLAMDIMDHLNKLVLENDERPRVCLYRDPINASSDVAAGEEITKVCTLVMVVVTEHLQNDDVAVLIKDETIGNTRLAKHCHPDLKYCVRPIYIEKERTYKAPTGLSTIKAVKWYDRESRFFKREIKMLFDQHIHYRKKRESRRQGTRQTYQFDSNSNELHPAEISIPKTNTETSSTDVNVIASDRSATSSDILKSVEDVNELCSLLSDTNMHHGQASGDNSLGERIRLPDSSLPRQAPGNLSARHMSTAASFGTTDSGYADTIPQQSCSSDVPPFVNSRLRSPLTQSVSGELPPANNSQTGSGNADSRTSSPSSNSTPSTSITTTSASSITSTASTVRTGRESAGFSYQETGESSSSESTSLAEVDGNSIGHANIDETNLVSDSSMRSNPSIQTESPGSDNPGSRANSAGQTSINKKDETLQQPDKGQSTGSQKESNGRKLQDDRLSDHMTQRKAIHSEVSKEATGQTDSSSSSRGSTEDEESDRDETVPKFIEASQRNPPKESMGIGVHVLSSTGPALSMSAKCAAPNDFKLMDGPTTSVFPVGAAQPVVNYHYHYHGDFPEHPGHHGYPPHPLAGPEFTPTHIEMPRTSNQPDARREQQNRPRDRAINIVNCSNVQIGGNEMLVSGIPEQRSRNVEMRNRNPDLCDSDQPPEYSVEDPLRTASEREQGQGGQDPEAAHERGSGSVFLQDQGLTQVKVGSDHRTSNADELAEKSKMFNTQIAGQSDTSSLPSVVSHDALGSDLKLSSQGQDDRSHSPAPGDESSPEALSASKDDTQDFSLTCLGLGSGSDLKELLMENEGKEVDATDTRGDFENIPGPGEASDKMFGADFPSCRLFCRDTRRRNMLTGSRLVSVGTCVDCGSGSDLD